MLAGVPMMNGSSTLEGYVPDFDATIVTRMLDAGAEIAGKVHCESFLHVRRQPHQRDRTGAQPAQDGIFGGRVILRQRRAWSRSAKSTWRSAATRAARSGCRPPSAASTA